MCYLSPIHLLWMPTIARLSWVQGYTLEINEDIQMRTEAICSEFAIAREWATITYIFVIIVVVESLSKSNFVTSWTVEHQAPGLHYLLAFAQIHIHWVGDATALFSFCLQLFPASWSFPMSWLFASGGQSFGASASATDLPMNIQGWFPLGLTGLILRSKDLSRVFFSPQSKSINSLAFGLLYDPTLTSAHAYWENHSFDYVNLCQQSDVSAFQYVVEVCHSFPSKEQMSLNFMATVTIPVILEPKRIKSVTASISPLLFTTKYWTRCHDLNFFNLSFKPVFSLSSFTLIERVFSSSFAAIRGMPAC